jgi:hypothetical protein
MLLSCATNAKAFSFAVNKGIDKDASQVLTNGFSGNWPGELGDGRATFWKARISLYLLVM